VKQTTAGKIGDAGRKYIGKTVEFHDFHGRTVKGVLEQATAPATAVYATLKTVGGRDCGVFRNTPVTVID